MIIELIRHGETVLQAGKYYQGAIDVPLSEEGKKKLEAGRAKRKSPVPAQVYVSPLCRARRTASILFPESRQITIPGLEEMHFGSFEGKNYRDMENDPDYRAWVDGMCLGRCPGGESRQEFTDRVSEAFLGLLRMEAGGNAGSGAGDNAGSGAGDNAGNNAGGNAGDNAGNSAGDNASPCNPDLVIVAHGGTQMALLDRFAEVENLQSRPDYYSWQLPCGHSYLLQVLPAERQEGHRPAGMPVLRILGTRDYTG